MLKGFVFDGLENKVYSSVQHALGVASEVSGLGKAKGD